MAIFLRLPLVFGALLFGLASLDSRQAVAQYCTSSMYSIACSSSDYINSFSTTGGLTNISNNNSGCNGNTGTNINYIYYPTKVHTTTLGSTVNFSLASGSFSQYMAIYVDWNQDGDFNDGGEQVYSSGTTKIASSGTTGSFSVPTTATVGTTRLRVRAIYSGTMSTCGSSSFGEVEDYNFEVLSPCEGIEDLISSNVYSKTADVSWSAASTSIGYEYVVSTVAGQPSGGGTPVSGTSAHLTNLSPSTTYFVYVRNQCDPTSWSIWSVVSFTTSSCGAPNLAFANIEPNAATAFWPSMPIAQAYEYIYGLDPNTPGAGIAGTVTTTSSFSMQGLLSDTTYYVHIRTHCVGNEISGYETFQFNTMPACVAPDITIINSAPDVEATWSPVHTAVAYEYAISSSQTPPSVGITIYINSLSVKIPADNNPYYLHVRTKCISIFNTSEWATITLREPPKTAVEDMDGRSLLLTAHPNPAKEKITIKLDGDISRGEPVTISDMAGRIVFEGRMETAEITVDMSNMPEGLYLVRSAGQVLRIAKN